MSQIYGEGEEEIGDDTDGLQLVGPALLIDWYFHWYFEEEIEECQYDSEQEQQDSDYDVGRAGKGGFYWEIGVVEEGGYSDEEGAGIELGGLLGECGEKREDEGRRIEKIEHYLNGACCSVEVNLVETLEEIRLVLHLLRDKEHGK